VRDVADRMDFAKLPLIVTDGFDFYEKVVRRVFGPACLYGQVLEQYGVGVPPVVAISPQQ